MTRFWDGQTDGQTDRQTDGQTDGVTALLDLLSPSATQVKIWKTMKTYIMNILKVKYREKYGKINKI